MVSLSNFLNLLQHWIGIIMLFGSKREHNKGRLLNRSNQAVWPLRKEQQTSQFIQSQKGENHAPFTLTQSWVEQICTKANNTSVRNSNHPINQSLKRNISSLTLKSPHTDAISSRHLWELRRRRGTRGIPAARTPAARHPCPDTPPSHTYKHSPERSTTPSQRTKLLADEAELGLWGVEWGFYLGSSELRRRREKVDLPAFLGPQTTTTGGAGSEEAAAAVAVAAAQSGGTTTSARADGEAPAMAPLSRAKQATVAARETASSPVQTRVSLFLDSIWSVGFDPTALNPAIIQWASWTTYGAMTGLWAHM